ncbi:MAG: DUF5309 domain-containing protein [Phycisphaerae bacterium]|nr:DUF5309 domain-containing protein [Phycisphaerae bacterium]
MDNGGTPNVVVGSVANIAKFTQWESDRVRTRVDERLGGKYVTQYLSRTGVQMDLLPCKKFPVEWLFILDTDQLKLRAKTGRKLLLQKLGLAGDYVEYQLLSEYTLEHRSVAQGYHGAFSALT